MNRVVLLFMLLLPLLATGCNSSYNLQGRVVRGPVSTMMFVDAHDPRLAGPGVPNVDVAIYRDPTKPNMQLTGRTVTPGNGQINLPVSVFGAGWMTEQWRITAHTPGFATADNFLALPSAKQDMRLLIMLAPGTSLQPNLGDDLMQQYEEFR